jgi:hypothetical protein
LYETNYRRMENTLGVLGTRHGTDKISTHGYHRFYHDILSSLRDRAFNMLEIGVAGYNSIDMWKAYFPQAKIYGIDINKECRDERICVFKADQSNTGQLQNIITQIPERCEFIIDDGSHLPEHQCLTFDIFFRELLQEGGTYIIEDIEVSYWKRGGLYGYSTSYGIGHPTSIIEKFKLVIDFINAKFININDSKHLQEKMGGTFSIDTLNMVSSITFGQNCIIIKKKQSYEYKYTDARPYRFANYI